MQREGHMRGRCAGGPGGHHRGPFGKLEREGFGRALRGGWGGGMRGPMGMGRAPRGNVRAAILLLLSEQPRNGYQIMQEIGERSNGVWHPSPGSVYPALQQLEDEALVRVQELDGQRAYALTEAGEMYLEAHRPEFGLPWAEASGAVGNDVHELVSLMRQSAAALFQVVRAGDSAQVARAAQLMRDTRRALYRILADEDETAGGQTS
jgi:DNA-binding PadR family transcriptional regulator